MDKYESKLRLDELKQLIGEEKYSQAADLCDEINWKKIKNINSLMQAGEAYEKVERYDDAREVLLTAYDRSPIGRMIIYRLAELAIRMKNFDEAQEYYDEFVDVAPHDNLRYVLRYEMMKAQGAEMSEKIALLEELKEEEYTEKWAFELAFLYHKAGESEKCIDACDELVLWFGDGPYVEKALELKMLYQPLNKIQEQKYRDFRMKKGSFVEIHSNDRIMGGEVSQDTVVIPDISINTEKYNTVNLQQELAKSMQQIAEATEKETVSDTMDMIKKMVEEIPYLALKPEEEEEAKEEEKQGLIEAEQEINQEIDQNFQKYLSEEIDGQMSLMVPSGQPAVKQITGQLSIDEVLAEWEMTRRAAEAAIADADQKKLQVEKAKALQEAEDIMKRLSEIVPQLEAGMPPEKILEERYTQDLPELSDEEEKAATAYVENANEILQGEIDRLSADLEEETPEASLQEDMTEMPEAATSEELTEAPQTEMPEEEMSESEPVEEETTAEAPAEEVADEAGPAKWVPKDIHDVADQAPHEKKVVPFVPPVIHAEEVAPEIPVPEVPVPEVETPIAESPVAETPVEETPAAETPQTEEKEIIRRRETSGLPDMSVTLSTAQLPDVTITEAEILAEEKKKEEAQKKLSPKEKMLEGRPKELSSEEKEIFSYFTAVNGMEEQITGVLNRSTKKIVTPGQHSGHILIQSGHGNGKTQLATDFVKALQKRAERKLGHVGRIEAAALNQKDIADLLKKVKGGVLIIENAGDLSREAAVRLSLNMQSDQSGLLVMMEDTRDGLAKALSRDSSFAEKFTERIIIPNFSIDELVEFAKAYANEQFYEIDEMAILALYDRISQIERLDEATTLAEVKEIVDDAIGRAEKISLRNLFSSKKASDGEYTLLKEKDFI